MPAKKKKQQKKKPAIKRENTWMSHVKSAHAKGKGKKSWK